jgi:NADH dehydrogenase FAD-containing subunit
MDDERCDVLILGASFAGIELVHRLRRSRAGRALKITVVDRQAAHGYIPLVQERLCERLDAAATELPTARAVAQAGARYVLGEVDRARRRRARSCWRRASASRGASW